MKADVRFDKKSDSYEPRATREKPVWECVEVEFVAKAQRPISLDDLRAVKSLETMELLRRGSRLSIQPVEPAAFRTIVKLIGTQSAKPPAKKRAR